MRNLRLTIPPFKDIIPVLQWLPGYSRKFFRPDLFAGLALATFVLPESMAYATLAGLPSHFGIYSCLAGSVFFAMFTTSRQVAVGPTSSIALMIGFHPITCSHSTAVGKPSLPTP